MSVDNDRLRTIFNKYSSYPEFLGLDIDDPNVPGAVDNTLLHLVASLDIVDDIKELVDIGADINAIGDMGFTPLHVAAMTGKVDAIKLLLSLGANVNIKNEWGQTPKTVAELSGRREVCLLFDGGVYHRKLR